MKLKKSKR